MTKKIINQDSQKDNIVNLSQKRYFACAHTCIGYVNYFDTIFKSQNLEKIYIIKGYYDSCLLDKIVKIASEKKYSIEYFLYPSDLKRLNGIIIKELKTAIINDNFNNLNISSSKYPVILENIINFHDFYDEIKLNRHKKEIFELTAKKNEYVNLAYKFLKAANEMAENTIELSKKYVNRDKLDASIDRLINKHVNEKHLQENRRNNNTDEYKFINSISSLGTVELDSFENGAKKIFFVSNDNFLGWEYTKKIFDKFEDLCKVICPDPLNPEKIKAVYLNDLKILFVIKNKIPDKIYDDKYDFINMERFINQNFKKDNKQKLKFIQKCFKSIIDEAVKYFKEADSINMAIENIYISSLKANKTEEKNKYTETVIKKILP